jgi:hypothetical protein
MKGLEIMAKPRIQKSEPEPLDLPAILRATRELEEAIRAYTCDNEPNGEWWGVLVNRLWQTDRALNPKRLKYGAAQRDEHFRGLPLLQSGPLSRIRVVVDKGICTFGVEGVIGPESLEGVLAKARQHAAKADYTAMPFDRRWAEELHAAVAALSMNDRGEQPEANGQPKGVSLLDAALILTEEDRPLAREKKSAWQKIRTPKLPASIGNCPNHKQVKLFAPSAIADFVEAVEGKTLCTQYKLRQRLNAKAREPRQK